MVADAAVLKVAGEAVAGELRAVVGQHPGELDPDAGQALGDVVDERRRVPGRLVAGDQLADPIAGGGVDRRQLPDPGRCPRGLPTEKGSRATRSPGGRRSGRTQRGRPWRRWSRWRWWLR